MAGNGQSIEKGLESGPVEGAGLRYYERRYYKMIPWDLKQEKRVMKIGFIGLGIMGRPMCRNLIRAGFDVTVLTHKQSVMDELAGEGATKAASIAELAQSSDIIITMLPDSPQVREVVLGPDGVRDHARSGSILLDMSSIDPTETKAIGEALKEQGIAMVDAPVSGGEAKAIDGTLAIMVGGAAADVERCRPLFEAMGATVTHMGELGAGNVTKLANQIIVALNMAAVAEALVFAKRSGVDPEKVWQAIRGGAAGSSVLDVKTPKFLAHNFKPSFRLELHNKDLTNALKAGEAVSANLPQTGRILAIMKELENQGHGPEDHTVLVRYFEELTGTSLAGSAE